FNNLTSSLQNKIQSTSAIHCFLIAGNENAVNASKTLTQQGFDVRAIKSPTVKAGAERLRICLHATNTEQELTQLAEALNQVFSN
ncbi:MAG TPA: 8-amino-7-oxononanoate synthase, partial [Bacteroidia bacterium]|nr:8-amino-7-oxononanoate synthase [Bacteroidia bacterium]